MGDLKFEDLRFQTDVAGETLGRWDVQLHGNCRRQVGGYVGRLVRGGSDGVIVVHGDYPDSEKSGETGLVWREQKFEKGQRTGV